MHCKTLMLHIILLVNLSEIILKILNMPPSNKLPIQSKNKDLKNFSIKKLNLN